MGKADAELRAAFREGASEEEIEAVLRHLFLWSYVMRDPFGRVCAVGRGTRAECVEHAFKLADAHAIEHFSLIEDSIDETRALNCPWRLLLWPPKLDPNPPFWAASADVFGDRA